MKTAIVGSRDFLDYGYMLEIISSIPITEIISGGAKGADSLGARFANERGIKLTEYIPDWEQFGRAAGMIRNRLIIDDSELVIAFWDGESKGTKNSIDRARKTGLKLIIVTYPTKDVELINL